MFGYVKAYKPELRIKEWEMYKAVYCSLCRELGKNYGVLARFTLSYDFTFLALLNMSLTDGFPDTIRKCCALNPIKKCNYCKNKQDSLSFAASSAMIMLYYKLLDNLEDEKGISKLKYLLTKPSFTRAYKKAAKNNAAVDNIFKEYYKAQITVQSKSDCGIDAAAEPTAVMLSKVFELCGADEFGRRALSRMGYCMGRYIYILDAAKDLPEDIKKHSFNPYKNNENYKQDANRQINICIAEAIKAFELIEIKQLKDILGNILYLGLEDTAKKELEI